MKFTSRPFVIIGGMAYLVVGTGHLSYELLIKGAAADAQLKAYLNGYDFRIFGHVLSLHRFHTGYSIMMAVQDLFIGVLCLTLRNPGKGTLLALALGGWAMLVLVRAYFTGGPPLYLSVVAAISFAIAFWKSVSHAQQSSDY